MAIIILNIKVQLLEIFCCWFWYLYEGRCKLDLSTTSCHTMCATRRGNIFFKQVLGWVKVTHQHFHRKVNRVQYVRMLEQYDVNTTLFHWKQIEMIVESHVCCITMVIDSTEQLQSTGITLCLCHCHYLCLFVVEGLSPHQSDHMSLRVL